MPHVRRFQCFLNLCDDDIRGHDTKDSHQGSLELTIKMPDDSEKPNEAKKKRRRKRQRGSSSKTDEEINDSDGICGQR